MGTEQADETRGKSDINILLSLLSLNGLGTLWHVPTNNEPEKDSV